MPRHDAVAAHQWTDARRRAREYQVTRLQLEIRRQLGDDLRRRSRSAPRGSRPVADWPFTSSQIRPARGMTDLGGRPDRADAAPKHRSLSRRPTACPSISLGLQIASRQVVADRVAEHVVERRGQGDVATPLPMATTSSISWCRLEVRGGYGTDAPLGTTASAGLEKKHGGSRVGSDPSRVRALRSCAPRNRCDARRTVAGLPAISTRASACAKCRRSCDD